MICTFCYLKCNIKEGAFGHCRVRTVSNGKLISTGGNFLQTICEDPIEKKPLYHFLPATLTMSVAKGGCNFSCDFCQNWELSQLSHNYKGTEISPEDLVEITLKRNLPSISFTYSEPLVWQDYVYKTSCIAKEKNLSTIMVTNGSFSEEALIRLSPVVDAYNIDLKGDANYYKTICHGELTPVYNAIEYLIKNKKHVEVTTLILEKFHSPEIIKQIGKELYNRGVEIWHITKFYPNYKMSNEKPTSDEYLKKIIEVAKNEKIPYIYPGNSMYFSPTICPNCHKTLFTNHNNHYLTKKELQSNIKDGKCAFCGKKIIS